MCQGCYEEYGSPKIVSEKTLAAAQLVYRIYEFSCVGGNLHAQLDDWNLEDEHWDELSTYNAKSDDQIKAEKACFDAFKNMTLEERASALAICDGYLEAPYARLSPAPMSDTGQPE